MTYLVTADIRFQDGALAGLLIPAGYSVTVPDERHAIRIASWLTRVHDELDFVRATGTGNKYEVVGNVHYAPMMPIIA